MCQYESALTQQNCIELRILFCQDVLHLTINESQIIFFPITTLVLQNITINTMNEIEYELREKDIRFYNDIKLINNADFKRSMTQNQAIIPGALSVIAFFYFLYYQDFRTGLIIGAIGVVWGLAVPAYLRYSSWQQVRQKYSDSDLKNILGKRTLKIQPGRIIETKDGEESTIPWKDVMRIEVNKARTYGFIYFDHNAALIIPKKTVKKAKFMDFMVQAMEFHAEADDD